MWEFSPTTIPANDSSHNIQLDCILLNRLSHFFTVPRSVQTSERSGYLITMLPRCTSTLFTTASLTDELCYRSASVAGYLITMPFHTHINSHHNSFTYWCNYVKTGHQLEVDHSDDVANTRHLNQQRKRLWNKTARKWPQQLLRVTVFQGQDLEQQEVPRWPAQQLQLLKLVLFLQQHTHHGLYLQTSMNNYSQKAE